jgi:hypothetical protein
VSRRIGDTFIVEPEKPQQCDGCGRIEELRPYGPGGSMVCFDCGMKDAAATEARFEARLDGVDLAASINATLCGPPAASLPEVIDGLCQYGEFGPGGTRVCRLPDQHDGDHDPQEVQP